MPWLLVWFVGLLVFAVALLASSQRNVRQCVIFLFLESTGSFFLVFGARSSGLVGHHTKIHSTTTTTTTTSTSCTACRSDWFVPFVPCLLAFWLACLLFSFFSRLVCSTVFLEEKCTRTHTLEQPVFVVLFTRAIQVRKISGTLCV